MDPAKNSGHNPYIYCIQGTFEAGISVWAPQKMSPKKLSSTLHKSFFFYQKDNNTHFFCVKFIESWNILNGYLKVMYNMVKERHGNFMKNTQQLPKP